MSHIPLKVGDPLPMLQISSLYNYSNDVLDFSAFKGKIIILDFWATWCGPCVASLPKLDSINTTFKDSIIIIPVTYQTTNEVQKFLSKSDKLKNIKLPFITEDTVLHKLFPHKMIPHEVWIGKDGKVKAITEATEITEANVRQAMNNQELSLNMKEDNLTFDDTKPLYTDPSILKRASITSYSLFAEKIPGLASSLAIFRDSLDAYSVKRFVGLNVRILRLFYSTYSVPRELMGAVNRKRFIVDLAGSDTNDVKQLVAYEFALKNAIPQEAFFKGMLEDLNNKTPYHGHIETRIGKCWEIRQIKGVNSNDSSGFRLTGKDIDSTNLWKFANVKKLATFLNAFNNVEPVVDATTGSLSQSINLYMRLDINEYPNWTEIRKNLKKYGLTIEEATREYEVFILKKKSNNGLTSDKNGFR
ncbi:TlpA family protein disulfide reductase [Chitinophaga pinensis]|nr:TlpA disulfide reductase family protein [Chitinophaga pinensis]